MKTFSLYYTKIIDRDLPAHLVVIKNSYPFQIGFTNIIKECIDLFNTDIHWDDMFTIDDAIDRINYGDKFFIGYYEGKLFGYCWLNEDDGVYKIYNVFSKKTNTKRIYGATDMLYYMIKNYTEGTITADVDEWNVKSINVFKKLGFTAL